MTPDGDRELTPPDRRLLTLLGLLRAEAPRPEDSLTDAVMRTARWQYALRGTIRLVTELIAALSDGLALVFGLRPIPPECGTR